MSHERRGGRIRDLAARLSPPPAIPPFYVQSPDPGDDEQRAIGWYMRRTRAGPALFLGHSAAAAESWLYRQLDAQAKRKPGRRRKVAG